MFLLAWTVGLWWFYIAVMWLKKKRDDLWQKNHVLYYLGYLAAIVFLVCDAFYNLVIGSLLFLDWPREFLFTSRLKRYRREVDVPAPSWRKAMASWFCVYMLNRFDPSGSHC